MLFSILGIMLGVSCSDSDDEMGDEGDGGTTATTPFKSVQVEADGEVILADTVFYNFQNVLFMYQVYLPDSNMYVLQHGFNTLKDENQLTLELSNVPRQATNFIKYTDWKETVRTFTIEESNRKHLILNSEGKRYTFRKF